ncbi:MAG: hypothetical protein IPN17_24830 [Deltaproteobacteria bacterium]|nr:hypothetical protein [Deltaproteobacteria bacterium]
MHSALAAGACAPHAPLEQVAVNVQEPPIAAHVPLRRPAPRVPEHTPVSLAPSLPVPVNVAPFTAPEKRVPSAQATVSEQPD